MSEIPRWLEPFRAGAENLQVPPFLRLPSPGARPAAVLVLFGEGTEGPDLLLIQRAVTLNNHAGQPAFPGGGIDPGDAGPVAAALREAQEETGLDPAGVEILAVLPELYLAHSGYRVTPVAGWWREPTEVFAADPGEVASVARVPIAELVEPANRLNVRSPSGHAAPAFQAGGMLVWGFTAGLLTQLLDVGGWSRPWDTTRVEDLPQEILDLAGGRSRGDGATGPRSAPAAGRQA
ncbi:NUDIX hydrolase [Actinomadura alba]|uniref:CoA pyrophosphatase n=2 Tax=Actinomadura alba TaxID=406431 RepID=A0ABR7M1E1_9ACTN|nr:CoA pyrophosphatase [Actinomadura alba]MBC6470856.1 CoA pyrophosphatase [Actinomadura alba]